MADAAIDYLRKENDDLRHLVIRLCKIALQIVIEQNNLPNLHDSQLPLQLPVELSPSEIVTALRELAVRSSTLSRDRSDGRTTQKLEALGLEFAVAAEDLEAMFSVPGADQQPAPRKRHSN